MRRVSQFLALASALLFAGGCGKEPEKPKKPMRFMAETQRTSQFVITIWNKNETAGLGSNVFGMEFLTPDKKAVDPGDISVQTFLEDQTKSSVSSIPGTAVLKRAETPGVFDVFAELPSDGRWKFNVLAGGQRVAFYYTVRLPEPAGKAGAKKEDR